MIVTKSILDFYLNYEECKSFSIGFLLIMLYCFYLNYEECKLQIKDEQAVE